MSSFGEKAEVAKEQSGLSYRLWDNYYGNSPRFDPKGHNMELFSSRRWRLDRAKQKAVVFVLNPKNYATHAWDNSIVVWLLGESSCSSPSTNELHGEKLN